MALAPHLPPLCLFSFRFGNNLTSSGSLCRLRRSPLIFNYLITMPELFNINWSRSRDAFFSNPDRSAAFVGGATFFALLVPTIIKLKPLGSQFRAARHDVSEAIGAFSSSFDDRNQTAAAVSRVEQEISDLTCVISQQPQFDSQLEAYRQRINGLKLPPMEKLGQGFGLTIQDPKTVTETDVSLGRYTTKDWEYGSYRSCSGCGGERPRCCTRYGRRLVTNTHKYRIDTTIHNHQQNILAGDNQIASSLPCGSYSRAFQIHAPEHRLIAESQHQETGSRSVGIKVEFSRDWGSQVDAHYELDGEVVETTIAVPREADINQTAALVHDKLYQFLLMAIAAFNATGTKYPALLNMAEKSFPALKEAAVQANQTAMTKQQTLINQLVQAAEKDDEFTEETSLWLPLLFLVPVVAALVTYFSLHLCAARQAESKSRPENGEEPSQSRRLSHV